MHDLLKDLNDRQREAVTAPLGPVLVLAGAGSGKTRVLTYRIAYLLQKKLFKPQDLLALTFTNKAAGEMSGRIERLIRPINGHTTEEKPINGHATGKKKGSAPIHRLGVTTDRKGSAPIHRLGVTMGTFHSVCARILRQEIENGNLKVSATSSSDVTEVFRPPLAYTRNFVIYDSEDSLRALKQILLELGLEEQFRPQVFAYYISAAKNRLLTPADLELDNAFFQETLQKVYEWYQEELQQSNALDFDDLLGLVCELFQENPKILEKYQERFCYVLVDEYQDTNHAQYVLLKLLAQDHSNIFVVGDDAQSIYGFRGANLQNILDFKKDYPEAKIISLEQNYRSTQNILDAAAKVIKLNPFQYEKNLWTQSAAGSKINLYEARDERDEAEFVVNVIASGAKQSQAVAEGFSPPDGGLKASVTYTPILDNFIKRVNRPIFRFSDLSETVILYRTHAQSRPFEEVLVGSGVPYQIVGGIKFYERKEIKDVISYLRLLQNPRDMVSLLRVINLPARGIGPAAFKEIAKGFAKSHYNYERLLLNLDKLDLTDKAAAGAREFFGLYSPLPSPPPPGEGSRKEDFLPLEGGGKVGVKNILDLMQFLLKRSGYKDLILDGTLEGATRWENVEELFNVAGKYKRLPWAEGLQAFLEEVALMTDLDKMEEEGGKLTLMTLHSAKGLEFQDVFLVGVEEGLLPHSRSLLNPEELAEEIRLAYVGMTRAKENLYLSFARQRQSYGEFKRCVPSRIIKAIPKRLLRRLN